MNNGEINTNIIFIAQPGELLLKALLLAYSLEKNCTLKKVVCIPERFRSQMPPEALYVFKKLKVDLQYFGNSFIGSKKKVVPGDWMSNKTYAIQSLNSLANILFLDSDIICINDPKFELTNAPIAAKPADFSVQANWPELYKNTLVTPTRRTTKTTVEKKLTPPYFNSGVLWLKQTDLKILIDEWQKMFLLLSDDKKTSNLQFDRFHRDQIALSLAIEHIKLDYYELNEKFNFPARRRNKFDSNAYFIHYHDVYTIQKHKRLICLYKQFLHDYPEVKPQYYANTTWRLLAKENNFGLITYKKYNKLKRRLTSILKHEG